MGLPVFIVFPTIPSPQTYRARSRCSGCSRMRSPSGSPGWSRRGGRWRCGRTPGGSAGSGGGTQGALEVLRGGEDLGHLVDGRDLRLFGGSVFGHTGIISYLPIPPPGRSPGEIHDQLESDVGERRPERDEKKGDPDGGEEGGPFRRSGSLHRNIPSRNPFCPSGVESVAIRRAGAPAEGISGSVFAQSGTEARMYRPILSERSWAPGSDRAPVRFPDALEIHELSGTGFAGGASSATGTAMGEDRIERAAAGSLPRAGGGSAFGKDSGSGICPDAGKGGSRGADGSSGRTRRSDGRTRGTGNAPPGTLRSRPGRNGNGHRRRRTG